MLHGPKRERAFTLVELLTVVSIIALLMAVAQPVLVGAKRAAVKSSCQSNLKQIGVGVALYAGDNDDTFPSATDQYWNDHIDSWSPPAPRLPNLYDVTQPYLSDARVLKCPSDDLQQIRVRGEKVVTTVPSQASYNRSSYYFFVPEHCGKDMSQMASINLPIARDFDPRWHSGYRYAHFTTPAYNFLYQDSHVVFTSLSDAGKKMNL